MNPLLETLRDAAQNNHLNIYSVSVIENGKQETLEIVSSSNCHNCYSVAKAFSVTAMGMLEDRGMLSTDDFVYPILSGQFPADFDENWKTVTIAHAMTHRLGIARGFLDIDCEYAPDYGTDFLHAVLSARLPFEPGTHYAYSDAAFYLVSRIFSAVSGEKMDDFLRRELFVPMGYREYAFSKCPMGYPIGATGLYITTEDMAKLGQMYLQGGEYNGRRYLSEHFVNKALGRFEFSAAWYGGFAKGGMYGQYLYLHPGKKIVIAFHGVNKNVNAAECLMKSAAPYFLS